MALVEIIDIFLHLDKYLALISEKYGLFIYAILFLIIFLETGVVVAPFFPGDSLLFAAGALATLGSLNVFWLLVLLTIAAILGDSTNYLIGSRVGPAVFRKEEGLFFNKKHLIKTQKFYERHGGKTIVIARFLPIIRTFAPFVAGIGRMRYKDFLFYNIAGGICWVGLFVLAGYFFGNIPIVKENFSLVIIAIIIVSLIPLVIEFFRSRRNSNKN